MAAEKFLLLARRAGSLWCSTSSTTTTSFSFSFSSSSATHAALARAWTTTAFDSTPTTAPPTPTPTAVVDEAGSSKVDSFQNDSSRRRQRSACDPNYSDKVEALYPTTLKQRRTGARVLQTLFDIIEKDGRLYDVLFVNFGVNFQEVRMSNDNKTAFVLWSSEEGCEDKADKALTKSAGYLRGKLASALPYRRVPNLKFVPDYLTEEEAKLEDIFDRIAEETKRVK